MASPVDVLSDALLVYVVSATLSSASAALLAAGAFGPLPLVGILLFAGSVLIAMQSLELLVLAYLRLEVAGPHEGIVFVVRALLAASWTAMVLGGVVIVWSSLDRLGPFRFEDGVGLTAVAALIAIAAVLLIPARFAATAGRALALVGGVAGAIGVVGEAFLAVQPLLGAPQGYEWFFAGAMPLINWNVPFGPVVAGSAFLLWWSYRYVPDEISAALSRGRAAPSPDPSP